MQETWVQSLSLNDLLEEKMATHSSILAWKIQWTEEPDRLQRVWHDWAQHRQMEHDMRNLKSIYVLKTASGSHWEKPRLEKATEHKPSWPVLTYLTPMWRRKCSYVQLIQSFNRIFFTISGSVATIYFPCEYSQVKVHLSRTCNSPSPKQTNSHILY